jgi:hypothetical protein
VNDLPKREKAYIVTIIRYNAIKIKQTIKYHLIITNELTIAPISDQQCRQSSDGIETHQSSRTGWECHRNIQQGTPLQGPTTTTMLNT